MNRQLIARPVRFLNDPGLQNEDPGQEGLTYIKKLLTLLFACVVVFSQGTTAFAKDKGARAPKEWAYNGTISDSMCGATHKAGGEHGKPMDAHDCTLSCVKGGSKYVFVSHGKVYEIENQDFAGLEEHAGHHVKVTGWKSSDGKTIKVTQITMRKSKKKMKAS